MKTETKTKTKQIIWAIILTLGLILFFATGCRSVQPVIVERIKIEYRDRLRVDSVYNRDTVEIYGRNDTIFKDVIRWRERFKFDTVSVVRVDSIPYPVEVIQEVNRLTKWQRWRLNALNVLAFIIVAYFAIKIRSL
jgi:hypothetical protein